MHTTFPFKARLHHPAEFTAALKGKRLARGNLFVLTSMINTSSVEARLGLIVAKRFAKRASTRNAIKRVTREAFRIKRADLPPGDYVIRMHSPVEWCTLTSLKRKVRIEIDMLLC